jgi:hypothetical protein
MRMPCDRSESSWTRCDVESRRSSARGALDQPRKRGTAWLGGRRAGGHLPFSVVAKKALEQALRQALALGHNFIGAEHVVLGLLATDDAPAAVTLTRLGVDVAEVRTRLIAELRRAA